jgi:hypothetical protein
LILTSFIGFFSKAAPGTDAGLNPFPKAPSAQGAKVKHKVFAACFLAAKSLSAIDG